MLIQPLMRHPSVRARALLRNGTIHPAIFLTASEYAPHIQRKKQTTREIFMCSCYVSMIDMLSDEKQAKRRYAGRHLLGVRVWQTPKGCPKGKAAPQTGGGIQAPVTEPIPSSASSSLCRCDSVRRGLPQQMKTS